MQFQKPDVMKVAGGRRVFEGYMVDTSTDHSKDLTAQDAFRSRMEAQCEQIQRYWLSQQTKCRCLSQDQAALEWIEQHADEFARDNDGA